VRAVVVGQRLRIEVSDNGRDGRSQERTGSPAEVIARLRGTDRHGHGLAVVRSAARDHDGRFELELGDEGSRASLILPCLTRAGTSAPGLLGIEA